MKIYLGKYIYMVYFLVVASLFALIYYGGYYYALNNMTADNIITKEKLKQDNPAINLENADSMAVDMKNTEEQKITNKTIYVEECYNIDTDEFSCKNERMPVALLGLDKNGVIDYLSSYSNERVDDKGRKLFNIQLVSFSDKQVVIRKSYREYNDDAYFVKSVDDEIVIYKKDKITVFFETGISISDFDDYHKKDLNKGFYIENVHDLYNYLEGITS